MLIWCQETEAGGVMVATAYFQLP